MASGFSSTCLWLGAEPMEETVPSPTRAMIVSSPAPPTRRSRLARTVTRATAITWMPSLATAATRGVWITLGLTLTCTASSTSRPARSMAAADEIVYEEADPGFFVHLGETQSGAFALIVASDHETSEIRLVDRHDPQAAARLVEPRTPQLQYAIEHRGGELYIRTNADGAEELQDHGRAGRGAGVGRNGATSSRIAPGP